jgi:hypothetical protein
MDADDDASDGRAQGPSRQIAIGIDVRITRV